MLWPSVRMVAVIVCSWKMFHHSLLFLMGQWMCLDWVQLPSISPTAVRFSPLLTPLHWVLPWLQMKRVP